MIRIALIAAVSACVAAPAVAETITVTESDCGGVVAHTPDASVNYQPGTGAGGVNVVPADLPGGSFSVKPPEKITIDIKIDLKERLGLPANAGQYSSESTIGQVTVENGRAYYNGQELATGAQNAVAAACNELRRKKAQTKR